MSFRKTLLFGALLLGLLGYIYYVELPKEKSKLEEKKFLGNFSVESIENISIRKGDAETIIENTTPKTATSTWKLKENPSAILDQGTVSGLVSALVGFELGSPIPKQELESELASYGLTAPRLTLKVKSSEKENTLLWGSTNQYASKDYVQVNEDVFLVPSSIFATFNKSGDDFRDKSPIKFSDGEVSQIVVSSSKEESFTIEKLSDGGFRILKPYEVPASEDSVSELLRAIKGLRADQFIDDDPKKFGFEKPVLTALLTLKDSKPPISVAVSSVKGEASEKAPTQQVFYFRANDSGSVYKLPNNPSLLLKGVGEYINKKPFTVSTFLVEKVEIQDSGQEPIILEKKDSKWLVSGKPGDENFVSGYIEGVSNIEASAYVSKFGPIAENRDEAYGFGSPKFKISITLLSDGSKPTVFLVGGDAPKSMGEDLVFASKEDKKDPFLISKKFLTSLKPKVDTLMAAAEPTKVPTP